MYASLMAKTRKRPPGDANEAAKAVIDQIITASESVQTKNPAAVALGRLGGLKGGKARKDALSPERRKEIARKAAESRWKAKKKS